MVSWGGSSWRGGVGLRKGIHKQARNGTRARQVLTGRELAELSCWRGNGTARHGPKRVGRLACSIVRGESTRAVRFGCRKFKGGVGLYRK
jgi:hypothetical protein